MNKKKTYEILGRTITGKFVSVGFCSSLRFAVDAFLSKYPRFLGEARIRAQMADDFGDGLLCADGSKWETIDSFQSSRELEQYRCE